MKKGFILFFLTALLFANEQKLNEFENQFEFLSKNKSPAKPFTKETLEIPKNAKMLKYIDISFEDEDGRIEKKTITIDKIVESQNNIIVSSDDVFNLASFAYSPIIETSFMTAPAISDKISAQPIVNKRVGIDQTPVQTTYVNNAETGETIKVADKLPLSSTQVSTVESDRTPKTTNNALSYKIATTSSSGGAINLGDISIVDDGLFIKTDDKILKTLNMIKIDRKVVLDFDKKLPLFKTKTFRFDNSGFVSATLGAHPNHYRISIAIDSGYNNFEVKEVVGGYIVALSNKVSTQPIANKKVETSEMAKVADKLPTEKASTQVSTVKADKTQKTTNNKSSYRIATTSASGVINLGDISIVDDGLFIKTDDKILKTLNMIKTDRKVVLDFDKKLPLFKTKTFRFDNSGFVSATLGAHPDYYRFGIVIDSKYSNFEVKEVIGGYIVVLK